MKEREFCTELVRSIGEQGGWVYKIPDAPHVPKQDGSPRFTPKRPFDIIAVMDGVPLAIEAKIKVNSGGLSLKAFTDFEKESLLAFREAGGRAFVAVSYRCELGPLVAKRLGCRTLLEAYFLPVGGLLFARAGTPLSRDELRAIGVEVPWLGKNRWGVRVALDTMRRSRNGGDGT
jgi:Holliday junction resolvase